MPALLSPRGSLRVLLIAACAAVLWATLFARDARAAGAVVDATFDAQVYQVNGPSGDPAIGRRRYVETLALTVTDLTSRDSWKSPRIDATVRVRLDGDLGQDPAERDSHVQGRFVPGLKETPFDLMVAYVDGRNYAGGLLGFRLGRQYLMDPLGFWSFDGGLLRVLTGVVVLEAYGGLEQRGGLSMLSTSRFEADGVLRGDRTGLPDSLWPAYLSESRVAPAYGFTLASQGFSFLDARVTYRKVLNQDTVVSSPYPNARGEFETFSGVRTSTERFGASAVAIADGLGGLRGDFVYDLYRLRASGYSASLDFTPRAPFSLGADAGYFLPSFDADSIFNWFSHMGTTTLTGRARVDPLRQLSVAASFGARRFDAEGDQSLVDVLGSVDATYRVPYVTARLRVMDEHGERGLRRGGDVSLRRLFVQGLYDASTRLSLYAWEDALRPQMSTTSVTYVLGGGFRPTPRSRVGFEWEHSMNSIVGNRFRALCTLDLMVL